LYDSNHFHTSEFAYFFFKFGEGHEGRKRLLVPPLIGWLSHWAVCHKLCLGANEGYCFKPTFAAPSESADPW